jgi:hypothetical protein
MHLWRSVRVMGSATTDHVAKVEDGVPPLQGPDAFGMPVLEWVQTVLPVLRARGLGPLEFLQHAGEVCRGFLNFNCNFVAFDSLWPTTQLRRDSLKLALRIVMGMAARHLDRCGG